MDEPVGDTIFLEWLPAGTFLRSGSSLADLSGERIRAPVTLRSYVTTTVEKAWSAPVTQLTCEHVPLLTSQRLGLAWLALPVAEFVHRYPRAEVTFYPGDLTMMALRAFSEIVSFDRKAAALLRDADFSWMEEGYSFDRSLVRDAEALVAAARNMRI